MYVRLRNEVLSERAAEERTDDVTADPRFGQPPSEKELAAMPRLES